MVGWGEVGDVVWWVGMWVKAVNKSSENISACFTVRKAYGEEK